MIPKPSHAAICLEKILSYVNAAKAQIDLYIIEKGAVREEKQFWVNQKNRLNSLINDVFARIPSAPSRDMIRCEQADEFRIDAIMGLLLQLNNEGKDAVEYYAKCLSEGIDLLEKKAA